MLLGAANLAAFFLNVNLPRELSFYPEAFINNLIDTNQVRARARCDASYGLPSPPQ